MAAHVAALVEVGEVAVVAGAEMFTFKQDDINDNGGKQLMKTFFC